MLGGTYLGLYGLPLVVGSAALLRLPTAYMITPKLATVAIRPNAQSVTLLTSAGN